MNRKILLFVSTIILNIQTGTCELPQPLAYYSFEGRQPSTLDRSFNNHTTLATGNYSFIDKGAPDGASLGAAVELNGGHLRIPSIDMNLMIRDSENGSYTMSAWIKPTDLGGEKFLFGQTSQGIHHGIRNGGYLHSAHWGADWNASTNLNDYLPQDDDGWIHAAWVYDASSDTAHIYLDGKLDWEGAKRAPNGSGNLIIGGRSGGGDGYVGLADDIAMWNSVLAPELISELASGSSPIGANLPFQITNISYIKETNVFEISWDSKPRRTYMLLYNLDLDQWEADIDDAIDSGGETTTYRFENPEGPNTRRLFFKVIEN